MIHPETGGNAQEKLTLAGAGEALSLGWSQRTGQAAGPHGFPKQELVLCRFQKIACVHTEKVTLPSILCTTSAYFIAGVCFPAARVK